jgi:sulfatase maturation enzyme AslB (radical SAM superfamily)
MNTVPSDVNGASRKHRLDIPLHNLLATANERSRLMPAEVPMQLREPVFPQYPELVGDVGPEPLPPPFQRKWTAPQIYRAMQGWMFPWIKSRLRSGDFQPIIAYLFTEYKCNLECHYCSAFNNKVKGMTEEVARRSIDWLEDTPCRVLALMGGEPLLRPQFLHKVVYYSSKKGFWPYVSTNARLLRPDIHSLPREIIEKQDHES